MSIPPNNSKRNLRISMIENRKCIMKGCNNIVLFHLHKYSDERFCYLHNNTHIHNKIETLEKGFFELKDYDCIIPKKKKCNSISYFNKLISVTRKIIYYRNKLFLKNKRKNRRGFFSYRCLDIILGYQFFLNILLTNKKRINKCSLMNNGIILPFIKIRGNNYIKYDANYYFRGNFLNSPIQTFDHSIINTFDSLEDFHSDLHILPYEKDIIKIKKNSEKYFFKLFKENYKYELSTISLDSFNIIKDYYFTNAVYDDYFNKVYLRKKILNNQFLRNIIILTNRCKTKVYFFHK